MPNPFRPLQKVLHVLCTEAEVLPATGQAVVDLVTPDLEEIYDRKMSGNSKIDNIWETKARSIYRPIQPIYRHEAHRLRYFIDGSTKTYFIGTILEQDRSSPVQLSQVGAAMIYRQEDGRLRVKESRRVILFTLDENQLSEELWNKASEAIAGLNGFELRGSGRNNDYADAMELKESRPRGAHRANWHMRELETNLALTVQRGENDWLVVDGSLGNEFENWQGASLIGIAKTFRRDSRFELGSGPRTKKFNLYSLLKDLQDSQRTIIFSRNNEGKIVFWYIRIRPQRHLDYPLMGVVKVEMPNPDQQALDSELIDEISGWIVGERNVTPHGRDSRWHTHLYPIYVAERVIQGSFYSDDVLKTGVRWPFQASQLQGDQ
jgi:hypothetical protein